VDILAALRHVLKPPAVTATYNERQDFQRRYRESALRLMAPIVGHRLALDEAQHNGFLSELYPGMDGFRLPLIAVQELHGAWQRYEHGSHLAVLGRKLHPFYGTYAPTRTSHLELFGTWLSQYSGARDLAVDVGTGCGVLSFMLSRASFPRVIATDINPNAIESVSRELKRMNQPPPLELRCVDLMGDIDEPVNLIVFNPPWIQGAIDDLLDQALHYQDDLFVRFFDQAARTLAADGRVVMVFSNIISLLQPHVQHPIEAELTRGRFELVQKLQRKVKPPPDANGRKRRTREKVEVWELALTD
jgi:SAM-dependent methyltransferase